MLCLTSFPILNFIKVIDFEQIKKKSIVETANTCMIFCIIVSPCFCYNLYTGWPKDFWKFSPGFLNFFQVFKNTHIWSIFSSLRLKTVLNSIKH